jgi:hypothetical protein
MITKNIFNSLLLEHLKMLKDSEWDEFSLYVASPFFNQGQFATDAVKLWKYILEEGFHNELQNIKEGESPSEIWQRDNICKVVLPSKADGHLDKTMSQLLGLVRGFLAYQESKIVSDEEQEFLLAKSYRNRENNKRFDSSIEKCKAYQEAKAYKDKTYYQRNFEIEYELYENAAMHNNGKGDLNLPKTIESLESYFLLQMLELINHSVLNSMMNSKGKGIAETINAVKKLYLRLPDKSSIIEVLYEQLMLNLAYSNASEEDFWKMYDFIKLKKDNIPEDLFKNLMVYARNYCSFWHNKGKQEFLQILFILQKEHDKEGYLLLNNKIPKTVILNLVQAWLRCGEKESVKELIQKYKDRILNDTSKQDLWQLNQALYDFACGKFDQALDGIVNIKYDDMYYKLTAERLIIKAYFELPKFWIKINKGREKDSLDNKLDSFKKLISDCSLDGKITIEHRDPQNQLIYAGVQLKKCTESDKSNPDYQETLEKLKKRILDNPNIAEKDWLNQKIFDLENTKKSLRA